MSLSLPTTIYTPYYCEENVYLLCKAMTGEDVSAVFVSNHNKTVALWNQKLSKDHYPVIWDYHCVLLLRGPDQFYICDLDTRLPCPCPLSNYLQQTFRQDIPTSFHSLFRVVPRDEYLDNLASDRSHMLDFDGYRQPPPPYEPLRGKNATESNLMESFVNMNPGGFGIVKDLKAMLHLANEPFLPASAP